MSHRSMRLRPDDCRSHRPTKFLLRTGGLFELEQGSYSALGEATHGRRKGRLEGALTTFTNVCNCLLPPVSSPRNTS